MSELRVMGREGDVKVEWDADKPAEVSSAQKVFEDNIAKGFLAFRVYDGGKKGEQLRKFDKTAERVILIPPVTGG